MSRKILSALFASLLISAALSVSCLAFDPTYADALNSLGLFNGTDNGYELENDATRVQIAVTFTRLLGKEAKAAAQQNAHPFTDVPDWAGDCIGYLYENYLVNGVSDTEFGSQNVASPMQFTAMLLRSLGYSDSGVNADFSYDGALQFALSCNLITSDDLARLSSSPALKRGDMAYLSYRALETPLKDARKTLSEKLCYEQKVFTEDLGEAAGVMKKYTPEKLFDGIEINLGKLTCRKKPDEIIIGMPKVETYGLRLYMSVDGGSYFEVPTAVNKMTTLWQKTTTFYEGAAQYMTELSVFFLPEYRSTLSFVLTKTTSESNMYIFVGRSQPLTVGK